MLFSQVNHSNSGPAGQKESDQNQSVNIKNCARVRRGNYLATAALVSLTLAAALVVSAGPALAAGGDGGGNPGSGGADAATATGGTGTAGAALGQGGGGGGAGTTGGTGGDGGGAGAGTGNTAGNTGNNAAGGSNAGGGGGGGGSHGSTGATLPVATSTGTAGGNGGNGDGTGNGGGGGGGGHGAVVTGSGVLGNLGVAVTGGNGGAGGAGAIGGNGGTGGIGLDLTNGAGATFTVNSAVAGGAGGAGGVAGGVAGSGGAGIVGQNLTITMGAGGTVAGGSGANAINFTGGANTLSFTNATSGLTGGIAVTGSLDFAQAAGITTVANNITGGALSKTGAGTITLSGTNSVTSATVNAGTLVNSGSLTTSGGVTNSASATYAQTAGSTNGGLTNSGQVNAFAGQINDGIINNTGGAFTIAGTVTTNSTFANNTGASLVVGFNSFTGVTTLTNAGTTSIGGGTLGTTNLNNTGTVNASGGTVNGVGVVNGAINNSTGGAFNVTGTVTSNSTFTNSTASSLLALSGTGNYTITGALTNSGATASGGGITIASGDALTAGGTTNNTGANFTNTGGTLNGGLTNAGTASNSGGVLGGLTNSGTYGQTAGTTAGGTINTGTINVSGGAINGAIANNAGGIFNVAGTVTSSSTFNNSTATSRLLVNSGTYTVVGAITNSGTNAAGGILVAAGATLDAQGLPSGITNNGGATFVNNGTTDANSVVNAVGATINNSGTITTTSMTNNGTITGAYAMAGGTLTGTGSVQNLAVNGGTFAPGNGTPGSMMNVTTSLSFQSAATFMVQINPTTASLAVVTGTAALGGATVAANFAAGSYVSKQYTIVQATGVVSGMFNPTVANTNLPSNFHTTLSYDTHDAFLNLTLNFAVPGGLNGNQQNVGNALTNFLNSTGSIPLVFGSLTPAGLTQISGETATGSQQTTFDAMNQFMGVMTDPFIAGRGDPVSAGGSPNAYASDGDASAYTSDGRKRTDAARDAYAMFTKAPLTQSYDPRWSVWAAGFGGAQSTDGNAAVGSSNTTSSIAGTAVGADYRFSPFTIAGFALAGGGTSFSAANGGSGRSDLFQAGAFIRHDAGAAYISGALAYGWQDITTNRTVTVAGTDMLHAEFNANAFSGRVEGGYRFVAPWVGGIGITPYAAAQFTTFDLPAYAENALAGTSAFALSYGAKSVTDPRSELGFRTDKSYAMPDGVLTLRGRLAWAHDYDTDRSIASTFQTLPGASFTVNGAAQASDSVLTTASIERKWINNWSIAATFEGEFSNVTASYAGKGVVRYVW
jgi:uncharacterized protein with beta-barrel porin domain